MRFWDREKEKEWLKRYLQTEPNAILFVYGPKSSGKTTLLMKVVEELSKDSFVYYWYDLREELITGYESVIELFFAEKGWIKSLLEAIPVKINLKVFELEPETLKELKDRKLKPFTEMRKQLERDRKKGMTPVIVFDELQELKEVYLNGDTRQRPLIKELFNFFVRITKVLHLAHIIVMTSDTFFIEQVYTDSTLKNTSRFYLVDFFDDETAKEILISEGLSEQDARYVVDWIGGVPWMLEEVLEDDPKQTVERLYRDAKGTLQELLDRIYEEGWYEEAVEFLRKILTEGAKIKKEDKRVLRKLVEYELLFYDPLERAVKFQSKLDEIAAREILEG